MKTSMLGGLLLISGVAALCQTPAKLEYEVASVKPAPPPGDGRILVGGRGGPGSSDPSQARYDNMTIKLLLTIAYNVKQYQVTGPSWIDSERYNILAKIPQGTTPEQAKVMLQNLLADRFKIVLRRETKDFPLYELTVGKGGSKLKASTGDPNAPLPELPPLPPPGPPKMGKDGMPELPKGGRGNMMVMMNGRMRVMGTTQPLSSLADLLSGQLGNPVIDKTGLTGFFDYTLDFAPDSMGGGRGGFAGLPPPPPPPPGGPGGPATDAAAPSDLPPLLTAVQEQLGLRLDKAKGPLEIIVVDKGDKVPTDN